jgi:hypothetical protein
MKRALDDLMYQGPAWLLKKRLEKHPSDGTEQALRVIKKTWPTTQTVNNRVYDNIEYTSAETRFKQELYVTLQSLGD